MAINRAMQKALKMLSYPDINLKKNYKLVRKVENITHPYYLKPFYKTWDHKVEFDNREIPVRIFSIDEKKRPILLFFHGGGWVTGNIDSYNNVCANLSSTTGCNVVSVDYRLAPEHPFPCGLEDCYYVAKEIFTHSEEFFDIGPEQITLIGDSAGGNLAAAISIMARDKGEFMPTKQILIYPAVNNDFTENSPFDSIRENGTDYLLTIKRLCDYMDMYGKTEADRNNPYFAPLLAEDLSNQPKTMIITAEFDPLRDEGEAYGKKLKEFGNEVVIYRVSDVLHGFFSLPHKYKPVRKCCRWIRKFVHENREVGEFEK